MACPTFHFHPQEFGHKGQEQSHSLCFTVWRTARFRMISINLSRKQSTKKRHNTWRLRGFIREASLSKISKSSRAAASSSLLLGSSTEWWLASDGEKKPKFFKDKEFLDSLNSKQLIKFVEVPCVIHFMKVFSKNFKNWKALKNAMFNKKKSYGGCVSFFENFCKVTASASGGSKRQ